LKTPVPWLAVGKYDDSGELCHFDQVAWHSPGR
jgi:hypothetical protein